MNTELESAIARIRECLDEVYQPEGVETWLTHPNRNLNNQTPATLISSGRLSAVSAVLAEAERLAGGAW